ncbi:MAG TPA: CHAT domain-containing protein [Mycobacteriales bacterium]|nr:CHAT domain-containing protein [Mycobacteriales bacterium]
MSRRPGRGADLADTAARLVGTDPALARRTAQDAVTAARTDRDGRAAALALWAHGRAALELGRLDEATQVLREAVREAGRAGEPEAAAEARVTLAYALSERGRTADALRQLDRAGDVLRGPLAGRVLMQRGVVLWRCGRTEEALEAYRRALPALRRGPDRLMEARLYNNRSLVHIDRNELAAAEADLLRTVELLRAEGQHALAADAETNLGFVTFRRGDVPAALGFLDSAEATYRANGVLPRELLLTRGELLLSVGAFDEARQTAERAIEQFTAAGWRSLLAEAQLLLSQAQLAGDDVAAAQGAASAAATLFGRQRRPGWAAVARYTALRADERAGQLTPQLRRRALREAGRLGARGWRAQELDARLIAARVALELGDVGTVRRELTRTAAARTRGSTELRIRAWYAEAMVRLATGREAAAEQALRAGFRVMEEQRATLGATELRVHVASHAHDVATLGIQLATRSGSPRKVLDWTERWRAGALRLRPVRPPDDEELAAALAELRRVAGDAEAALLAGRPPERLLARRSTLEDRVRRLTRQAAGPLFAPAQEPPTVERIGAELGDAVLVELIATVEDDVLSAVTVRDGEPRLHALGGRDAPRRELSALLFALRRLALGHGSAEAALEQVRRHAERLEAAVLGPLREVIADRPLVVVPTGSLRSVPWALLPACTGRPVTVAPSAAVWLQATSRRRPSGQRVVLVCGPGLPGAAAEISALARAYPAAARLEGADATVDGVLRALDGADVAHVAAHGRLRGDNPLFSALTMSDGPLTAYDLERLSRAPQLMLLPACQSGAGNVLAGDEVMGLTSALFALGARTAVATVIPVPDEATRPLMLALHDGLRRGLPVARALADAQAVADRSDPAALATAGGFVCYGAG